jgi:hypothetical protein
MSQEILTVIHELSDLHTEIKQYTQTRSLPSILNDIIHTLSWLPGDLQTPISAWNWVKSNMYQKRSPPVVIHLKDVMQCTEILDDYVKNAHKLKNLDALIASELRFLTDASGVNRQIKILQDDSERLYNRLSEGQSQKQTVVSYPGIGQMEKLVIYREMKRLLQDMQRLITTGEVNDIMTFKLNKYNTYDMGSIVVTLENDTDQRITQLSSTNTTTESTSGNHTACIHTLFLRLKTSHI